MFILDATLSATSARQHTWGWPQRVWGWPQHVHPSAFLTVCVSRHHVRARGKHSGVSPPAEPYKAHRLLYHSTLGLRVIKKKNLSTGPKHAFQRFLTCH